MESLIGFGVEQNKNCMQEKKRETSLPISHFGKILIEKKIKLKLSLIFIREGGEGVVFN